MVGDILQPTHLIFVLVIALLVLGPKRLPEVAKTLGKGIRDFRGAISGDSDDHGPHDNEPHGYLARDDASGHQDTAAEPEPPTGHTAAPSEPAAAPQPAAPSEPAAAPQPAAQSSPPAPPVTPASTAPPAPPDAADPWPQPAGDPVQPVATPAATAPSPPAAPPAAPHEHPASGAGEAPGPPADRPE